MAYPAPLPTTDEVIATVVVLAWGERKSRNIYAEDDAMRAEKLITLYFTFFLGIGNDLHGHKNLSYHCAKFC